MGSKNAHGCHARRTLPDVYFLPVFKGKKITSYTFQLDSKHLSIQVKDPGPLRSWIRRRKNIRFQKRTVSGPHLLLLSIHTKSCLIHQFSSHCLEFLMWFWIVLLEHAPIHLFFIFPRIRRILLGSIPRIRKIFLGIFPRIRKISQNRADPPVTTQQASIATTKAPGYTQLVLL